MKNSCLCIFFIWLFVTFTATATHNRAGEITFEQVSDLTYKVTIKTFTYTLSLADRPELIVNWGDNSTSEVRRTPYNRNGTLRLPGYYQLNVYDTIHTFPGPGIYEVVVQDPNRNFGVVNIPNSVNVVFSIATTILISPELGSNSTPVLLSMPIDKAARGHVFVHNPVAFDADGDSISYKLSVCRGENGQQLKSYSYPKSSNQPIYIDPVYGNLIWDAPIDTGIYNVAIEIEEWRSGFKIGNVLRDMQVEVYETENNPPVNQLVHDYCVVAGDSVVFDLYSTDIDNDRIFQSFLGGPFRLQNPPEIIELIDTIGITGTRFIWETNCDHVKRLPYNLIVKSTDYNADVPLVDIDNFSIRVIAPPPEGLEANASNTKIELNWIPQTCESIIGYQVYRKIGKGDFENDSCTTGVGINSGYDMIANVNGASSGNYTDDDNGQGLAQGFEYCYVIAAVYRDGAVSMVSNEACASLLPGVPPLMNTSVINISASDGSVLVSWLKPEKLDTIPANGPYEVVISSSEDKEGLAMEEIHSFISNNLEDTSYLHEGVNTIKFPYSYRVEIYNNEPGNRFLLGGAETASTLVPKLTPGDNQILIEFDKSVPWLNESYEIFNYNKNTKVLDSIGVAYDRAYAVTGLKNGVEYCYALKSKGYRIIDSLRFDNENWSHYNCTVPIDTFPPCAPEIEVESICDSLTNLISWENLNRTCANDVVKYKVFYSERTEQDLELIAEITNPLDTFYYHTPPNGPAGCYGVSAVDSFENEGAISVPFCVDECSGYELPNIFTPNNDGNLDVYTSINPNGYVKKVEMKVFNRWGELVFKTNDPDINWDGRYMKNNKIVSSGVYYYICTVYENRLVGMVTRDLVGFIHVYAGGADYTPVLE